MPEPVITGAIVSPGHDGQAELVVSVRYPNGARGDVTLDAECGRKLMRDCGVDTATELRGQPWKRLLDVLDQEPSPRGDQTPCLT
jgi:hypothetical protein